jgi:hypothetical protein
MVLPFIRQPGCGLLQLSCSKKTGTQRTKHPDLASTIPGPRLACSRFVSPCPSSSANSPARNGKMAVHRLQHSGSSQNTQRPSMLTASLRDPARVSTPKMSSSITKTTLRSVAVILSSRNCCFTCKCCSHDSQCCGRMSLLIHLTAVAYSGLFIPADRILEVVPWS